MAFCSNFNKYYTNINDVDPIYYDLFPVNQSNMNDKKQQMSNVIIIYDRIFIYYVINNIFIYNYFSINSIIMLI